jgi:hypothetical protein
MWRRSCRHWLQEVPLVAERRLPMALATADYTVAIDFAAEVRQFRP